MHPEFGPRSESIRHFIARHGWFAASVTALPVDASARRYFRLRRGDTSALLMDAPPPEDVETYVRIAEHLRRLGFSTPAILAVDTAQGLALIEDFGDATYTRLLAEGYDETSLYRLATRVLIQLHRHPQAAAVAVAPYDRAFLLRETTQFCDWYLPTLLGRPLSAMQREDYLGLWEGALAPLLDAPPMLVLRDFHVDNLMLLAGRAGVYACGLLDFQGALLGHRAYDPMSLFEDARRDVPAALAEQLLVEYLDAFPELDRDGFRDAYLRLAAQRHVKVAGIFLRLWLHQGRDQYLAHVPRVLRLLGRALAHPPLAPLRHWLERHAPGWEQPLPKPQRQPLLSAIQAAPAAD